MPYVPKKKSPEERGVFTTAKGEKMKAINLSVPYGIYELMEKAARQDDRKVGPWTVKIIKEKFEQGE